MKNTYSVGVKMEQAAAIIKEYAFCTEVEQTALSQACGRILAEDITAKENVPPFDRSPYDGYAFRAKDVSGASEQTPVTLQIVEEVPAGKAPSGEIGPGEAIKILTGAPIPKGADAVEMFEKTRFDQKQVTFFAPLPAGSNICRAGEDIQEGRTVLKKGTRLSGGDIGMLAALGYPMVNCHRKVRCAVISTGSELVSVDSALAPGKIRSSSGYMIQSVLRQWGMNCDIYGIVEDECAAVGEAVKACAASYDIVLTTGGVSVGDYDFAGRAMESIGAEILLWKVDMKPGMAFLAAVYQGKIILCLSGNPSAAAAALYMIGYPVLRQMAGGVGDGWKKCTVHLLHGYPKKNQKRRFLPGILRIFDGKAYLDAAKEQGNGMINPWSCCNVIGEIPKGTPPLEAGSLVDAYYFGE